MPQIFVTSESSVNRHGVFAIEQKPPTVLRVQGTGIIGYLGQFPWGPAQQTLQPADIGTAINTYAPAGMSRTGSGYLGLIAKALPPGFYLLRITGVGAAAAAVDLMKSATDVCTLTLKYPGTAGNSVTATVTTATDGDVNHFDLAVSVTGSSGTTTDKIKNINFSGVGADSTFNFTDAKLIGSLTKNNNGVPDTGTFACIGGTSPAIISSDYIGTQGTGNKGMALLEGHSGIRHVYVDDPGSSLRAAVNAGGLAHAAYMGNRVFYGNGDSGLTSAATITDVAAYRSTRFVYVDPWVYIRDDVDGTERLVPPAPFAGSVAAQTSPSTSIAWKATEQTAKLAGIVRLEANRGGATGTQTEQGIVTIIPEDEGGFSFEADPVTIAPQDAARKSLRRTRVGDAVASAFVLGNRGNVDAPNVEKFQDDVMMSLGNLLDGLKRAQKVDPAHNLFVKDFYIAPSDAVNTKADIQGGKFRVSSDVTIGSAMEQIFFLFNFGETVTVTAQ